MRVTGGIYSRRQVACPPGVIRPAMDRMRESVFAILGDLSGCSFLDLYSGSGIIGIEAASRGADPVIHVEMDKRKIQTLRKNTSFVEAKVSIVTIRAERYLASCRRSFDLIFADPPFPDKNKAKILELIVEHGLLNAGGLLLIHFPQEDELPDTIGNIEKVDTRKYGRSIVNFYRSTESAQAVQRSSNVVP